MPVQSDFPDKWVCDSEDKDVIVEVRVANDGARKQILGQEAITDFEWIEIPTTDVEMWTEKGGAAAIQKTAKVRFPTEWGQRRSGLKHNSPRKVIDRFEPGDARPFMFGRVKMRGEDDIWVTTHLGWVGGVGSAEGNNKSKIWIYDFAEFFTGVPAKETFNDPTVETAVQKISSLITSNTVVPLSAYKIITPDTEEEIAKFTEGALQEGDIKGVRQSVENQGPYYSVQPNTSVYTDEDKILYSENVAPWPGYELENETTDINSVVIDTKPNTELHIRNKADTRHFTPNHDTLLDVVEWFEHKTQCKIHFEPGMHGKSVHMVVDIVPSRRTFAAREVIKNADTDGVRVSAGAVSDTVNKFTYHEPVDILKNDALYEMKPINTLHLRGTYGKGDFTDKAKGALKGAAGAAVNVATGGSNPLTGATDVLPDNDGPPGETYPVVTVQSPPLVEAANGVELAGEVVESDASTLDSAEREAFSRLTEIMSETTEGEIIMKGEPGLLPHDKVVAYEVCNGDVQYEQTPVEYEVESVKHEASAKDRYETRITVSVYANDTNIEVVNKDMENNDKYGS